MSVLKGWDGFINRPSLLPTAKWPLLSSMIARARTAADLLNDRVLPFFQQHEIALSRVLTDRGTEFCGTDGHEYELYLAVEYRLHPDQGQEPPDQWHL